MFISSRLRFGMAILLLVMPSLAHASGDPSILYWLFFLLCWHIGFCIFIFLSKKMEKRRTVVVSTYLVCLVISWIWAWSFAGPDFDVVYSILIAWPPLLIFLFIPRNPRKAQQPTGIAPDD